MVNPEVPKRPAKRRATPFEIELEQFAWKSEQEACDGLNWLADWINEVPREPKVNPAAVWPALQPLPKVPLPEFPVEGLPKFVRNWVNEMSRATQTPPDLAAMLSLAAGSAAVGNRCRITGRDGWSEPLSLFAAVITESAPRQSAVFAEALRPLREWEAQVRRRFTQTTTRRQEQDGLPRPSPERAHETGKEARPTADLLAHFPPGRQSA